MGTRNNLQKVHRRPKARNKKPLYERKVIVILAEGAVTEPLYFQSINRLDDFSYVNIIITPGPPSENKKTKKHKSDPLSVVQKCIEIRDSKKYDEVDAYFAVVDKDDWLEHKPGEKSVLEKAQQLAEKEEIDLVISNLKFEVWLMWHLDASIKNFPITSAGIDEVCKRNEILTERKRLHQNFPIGNYEQAIKKSSERGIPAIGEVGPHKTSGVPHIFFKLKELKNEFQ